MDLHGLKRGDAAKTYTARNRQVSGCFACCFALPDLVVALKVPRTVLALVEAAPTDLAVRMFTRSRRCSVDSIGNALLPHATHYRGSSETAGPMAPLSLCGAEENATGR